MKAARTHLRYLQRDGVARDGTPGQLYDAERDVAEAKSFVDRADGDRHQFRIIVAPEDAAEYEDIRDYTRRFMAVVAWDLGTRLDWVAVDHHNTGHPHSHVVMRGKDERGKDLIVAREYITQGVRSRTQAIVSMDLGPRTDGEIEDRLRQEVGQDRLTSLDRGLVREADIGGVVDASRTRTSEHACFRLVNGRFALVTRSRDFTLVPWRPELERLRDRVIGGRVVGAEFAIERGRERSGPSLPSM